MAARQAWVGAAMAAFAILMPSGPSRADRGLDGYAFVAGYYDDNVFSYSDEDRVRYEAGNESDRFPIESLEDYVTTLAVRGDYRWNVTDHSLWLVRLLYDGSLYALNDDRTNHRFGVLLERSWGSSTIGVSAGYAPDYYLRHLYWRPMPGRPDNVRYAPAIYDRYSISAEGKTALARTVDGRLTFGYARRDYAYPFDERDSDAYSAIARLDLALHRRFDVSILVSGELSSARGADSTAPDAVDTSNYVAGAGLEGTWRMNRWLRFVQSFGYEQQTYTTDNVGDVSHHDRIDDEIFSSSELQMIVVEGWQPKVFFQYRESSSTTPPGIAEFGEFSDVRVGLQVTYYF